MGAHALLSASGASRWIACPPSARKEAQKQDEQSTYAAEGTTAHELAEVELAQKLKLIDKKKYLLQRSDIEMNEYFCPEMHDYMEDYVAAVLERYEAAKAEDPGAIICLEERLDFSPWVTEGFGTGDVVMVYGSTVEVIDLKYGKGVPVSAENNAQLMLYGLGAYNAYDMLYGLDKVVMTIMQPRLDSISTFEIDVADLLQWAETIVKPAAELAWKGEGEFCAGDHCKFCKIRATCRARAEANMALAKHDFADADELDPEELADILHKAGELQAWVSDIQSYALDQAENHGVKFPGWKLVEGRSNRKYTDDDAVAGTLMAAGYDEDKIYEKKLLGITKLEKEVGKKTVKELLSDLIVKPPGKLTLAPLDDKRPEVSSAEAAAADFA